MNISHNGREVSSNCPPILHPKEVVGVPETRRGCSSSCGREECGNHELEKVNLQQIE
jgi:hypothetical protein